MYSREKFDSYDVKDFDRNRNKCYKFEDQSRPAPKCKKHFNEESAVDALTGMSGVNKFKVNLFYVITRAIFFDRKKYIFDFILAKF